MPQYLLTAKTSGGRKVTELVTADSARAAIDDLKSRGHDAIVLHTDDAGAQVVKPMQMTPLLGAYDSCRGRLAPGEGIGFAWAARRGARRVHAVFRQ